MSMSERFDGWGRRLSQLIDEVPATPSPREPLAGFLSWQQRMCSIREITTLVDQQYLLNRNTC